MKRAVVFAYHKVGVRCIKVLLARDIDIPLIITHRDAPSETIWFDSVASTAADYGIACITPEEPNSPQTVQQVSALAPDFLFSFYYRKLLAAPLLALARCGALNMHGSLLPKYRGRAPVNWAVLHGETETGATLHHMTEKPDRGDIVAQTAVPILPDDTAQEVFDKVTVAAEWTLDRVLPSLMLGNAPRTPQDDAIASYFGARKPEDGVIDWACDATSIHNLVRAVAPPYPGAFTTLGGVDARVLRTTRVVDVTTPPTSVPSIRLRDDRLIAYCGGGGALWVLALEIGDRPISPAEFAARFGAAATCGVALR